MFAWSSLEFETQKNRLNTQLEYEQAQLEKEMRKAESWEETIHKEEEKAADRKKAKTLEYIALCPFKRCSCQAQFL